MRPLSGPLTSEPVGRVSITVGPIPSASTTDGSEPKAELPENKRNVIGNIDSSAPVTQSKPEPEAKSEASYDPLFDGEPDESGVQPKQEPTGGSATVLPTLAGSSSVTPGSQKLPSQAGLVPPSKKPDIPLLDPVTYGEYSSDILLAASIDGQVVLWDRRAQTHAGVGRLEMADKCPPWCLSVRLVFAFHFQVYLPQGDAWMNRPAGRVTARKSMQDDGTELWTCGTLAC